MKRLGFKFSTNGLENSEVLYNLFKGNFEDIPFNRDSRLFAGLLREYIQLYGKICTKYLPEDKVQIYEKECISERVTKNGFGAVISRYCIKWYRRPTGVYTTQGLIKASDIIRNLRKGQAIGEAMDTFSEMIDSKNMDPMTNRASENERFNSDLKKIISRYSCGNKALKRFEDNLVRYANKEKSIKLVEPSLRSSFFNKEQDYTRLIVHLIEKRKLNARFKYIENSIVNVKIISRDSQNRPLKVTSNYKYYPYRDGVEVGEVQLIFKQGIPKCIYLLEHTKNCIKPDENVVSNFMNGKYTVR